MVVKVRVYEQRRHTSSQSQSQTQPPSGEKTTETKEPVQSQSPAGEKPTPSKAQSPSSSTLSTDPTTRQLSHVTTLSSDPSPSQSPSSTQQSRLYHTITTLAHTSRSRLRRVADKYDNAQSRRPYFTQFLCTLVIYFFGDVCAQMVALSGENDEEEEEEDNKGEDGEKKGYDPIRTIRHLCVGGILAVPNWKWFMFLHHHFNYPSITLSILTKVTISQIIYTPIFNTYFFSAHSLLAGNNIADTIERVVAAVPVSVVNSLMVWPAVTGLTFLYVQPQYRSLFSGVVAIGWQTYLSWLNSKAAREVRMERVEENEREKGKGTEKDLSEQKHIAVVATAAAS